eukprot:324032_1
MFTNLDWSFIQKKLLENPKSVGAVGAVAAVTIVYLLSRSSGNDEDMDLIPDFAKQDIDYTFTSRFGKGKNRRRTISDHRRKRPKPLQDNNNTHTQQNENELKYQEIDTDEKEIKYSLLDPTNPNYSYDMVNNDDYDEDDESENEEAFSADPFYVPFKVNNAKTKRKPDAPFMAMFKMYANKNQRSMGINDNKMEQNNEIDMDINDEHEDIINADDEEEKKEEYNNNNNNNIDSDAGSSPPLNPHIPSHNIGALNGMNSSVKGVNSLDNLRERYYKQELPKSLQPDVLSNAFSSDNQKAIQNDLNADDSLLGGIKQSVQMITQSND